ncbi:MAG: FeoB-associated Cys-rich membrane protein [Ruminococcaceae bacterium]|nr:FeoB-associated Cys-rich membrane protein [Oscillospiraceae bacterium]
MLIIAVIAAIIGSALLYVYRSKKKGIKCIGCPNGAKCSGNCSECNGKCGGCSGSENKQ